MLLSGPLVLALFASLCSAEYYHVIGEGFKDYIGDSSFHVDNFTEISIYGIPPPPGGNNALYLTDNTLVTQTPIVHIPSTQAINIQFTFYCDDSPSQLEIRMSYPWEGEDVVLCGQNSAIARPGEWVTEIFTRECYDTCTHIDLWLYGTTIEEGQIVGIHSISLTTEDSTFAPTDITQSTTTTTPTTTTTTTTPTTTTQPACLSPGSSCASSHGTCRTSCNSHEYSYGSCGGTSCTCCKLGWPSGRYSLPKPKEGCPVNDKFTWSSDGWTHQATEKKGNDIGDANICYIDHMDASCSSTEVQRRYCTKTSSSIEFGSWPKGDYCILRSGDSCPSGFDYGYILWDDHDKRGSGSSSGGTLPDGTYHYYSTALQYCCRNDGKYNTAMKIPTEEPFLLMMNSGYHCQKVEGMNYTVQSIQINTENDDNESKGSGDYPYTCNYEGHGGCSTSGTHAIDDPKVHYCYYN